jgi:hypothetical protein
VVSFLGALYVISLIYTHHISINRDTSCVDNEPGRSVQAVRVV